MKFAATGGATRLGVIVGKPHAFGGHFVEVRRPNGHHALIVDTDIGPADVVSHDEDDVGFLVFAFFLGRGRADNSGHQRQGQDYGQRGQESVVWLFGHTYLLV